MDTRLKTFLCILVVVPLGFRAKFYSGPLENWVNDYLAGMLYVVFWCLFIFLLLPGKSALLKIPLWALCATCALEILQLWKPPFLEAARSSFMGKTLLGTTFAWWDFPHYFAGALMGWLLIKFLQSRS